MKIRLYLAILAGKMAIFFSRLAGNQGTNFPGRLARRIYPPILTELAGNILRETVIITGTNGKTTTSNMMAEIIKENNFSYVHNRAGANMITGITTAFIQATNLSGKREFDYGLLEVDEANVPLLLQEIPVKALLITNFFRDQLDRFGELDNTINIIKEAVQDTDIELILNADDPLVSHFQNQTGLNCWYFGFDDTVYDDIASAESREGRHCVFCGHELVYERFHYAQLGKYSCPQCQNQNPARDFSAHGLNLSPAISFQVNNLPIQSPYQGFYNAYNILAAVSLAKRMGFPDETIQTAISSYHPQAGRMEKFIINGKAVLLILVKNPTGLNQSLVALTQETANKNVFMALNDNAADGRDISWIWDADLEILANRQEDINYLICSGLRSGDIAVRAKYAGFDPARIVIKTRLQEGIARAVEGSNDTAYILSTYTALFTCRQILLKMQTKAKRQSNQSQYQRQSG